MRWQGFLVGVLGLIALDVILQPAAAGKVATVGTGLSGVLQRIEDPTLPLFGSSSSSAKKTSTTTGTSAALT